MKSFLEHLNEEVLPTVQVADGGLDISKPAVRAAINAAIAGVVSQPAVTPYVVFNRLSKLLAQYHIILPKRFLEGDKGVEVFELRQFGHKMGMTDSGEFVNEVPSTHYLFLQYGILSPFGITYAKPVVGGMFKVAARIVDKEELDKLIDMAEITMAEEAECMQAIYKANAPKEEMKDITSDEKKKGNKEAVATSQKDLSEERKRSASVADAFLSGKKANQRTLKTDGKSVTYHGNTIAKHEDDHVHVTTAGYGHSPSTRGHVNSILHRLGSEKLSVRKGQLHHGDKPIDSKDWIKVPKSSVSEEKNDLKGACWKGYTAKGLKKKGNRMVPNCVPVEEATDKDRELSKIANKAISKGHPVKKLPAGRAEYSTLPKGMAKGINLERGRWSGHGRFNEEQINELEKKTIGNYLKKAHVSGLAAADDAADAYHRKDYKELHKHNRTGEKRERGVNLAVDKLTGRAHVSVKEEKKLYNVGATKKDKSGRTVERRDYSTHSSIVATHDKEGKSLQNKWGGHNPDRVGKLKYIQKHFDKLEEKHLTSAEKSKKEEIVKSMKKGLAGFKERYGKRAKAVMYATATKQAEKIAEAKKDDGTVLVSPKGYKGAGQVTRIPKKEYDPKKHNLASE